MAFSNKALPGRFYGCSHDVPVASYDFLFTFYAASGVALLGGLKCLSVVHFTVEFNLEIIAEREAKETYQELSIKRKRNVP